MSETDWRFLPRLATHRLRFRTLRGQQALIADEAELSQGSQAFHPPRILGPEERQELPILDRLEREINRERRGESPLVAVSPLVSQRFPSPKFPQAIRSDPASGLGFPRQRSPPH